MTNIKSVGMLLAGGLLMGSVGAPALAQIDNGVFVTVASGLTQPLGLIPEPGNDDRLYSVGKTGLIQLVTVARNGDAEIYSVAPTPALDLRSVVHSADNSGLLGMAFPPDYATSGWMYVFYTTTQSGTGQGMICRYQRDPANPGQFLASSREVVFTSLIGIYHHGGTIRFGPDGFLYFAKGDEGNIGLLSARNPGVLYGKMIRIDPSRDDFPLDPNRNYGIPIDNPFALAPGGLPEVWGVGLRSPWQFSFDRQNGDLWMADVGESTWEEITRIAAGTPRVDYGWPSYEGTVAGPFGTLGANPNLISFPAYVYPHEVLPGYTQEQTGCSINGGFVYRGTRVPAWTGRYFWSDFCGNRVFSAEHNAATGRLVDVRDMTPGLMLPAGGVTPPPMGNMVGFGEDNFGELFVIELFTGRIRKLAPRYAAADIGSSGGQAGPDGELDNNDFVVFIDWFFNADARCDMGKTGGVPGGDGIFDNNDFIVFIDRYFTYQPASQP